MKQLLEYHDGILVEALTPWLIAKSMDPQLVCNEIAITIASGWLLLAKIIEYKFMSNVDVNLICRVVHSSKAFEYVPDIQKSICRFLLKYFELYEREINVAKVGQNLYGAWIKIWDVVYVMRCGVKDRQDEIVNILVQTKDKMEAIMRKDKSLECLVDLLNINDETIAC